MGWIVRRFAVVAVVVAMVVVATPAAFASAVLDRVTVGGPDLDLIGPGGDANVSLVAIQKADGTIGGQWHDQSVGGGIHVTISCVAVVGNEAWVSGLVTGATGGFGGAVGLPAIIRIKDNGTSANDAADQVSLTTPTLSADDCLLMPPLQLFDLSKGQAKVN